MHFRPFFLGVSAIIALADVVAAFLSHNNTDSEFTSWSPIDNLERLNRQEARERGLDEQMKSLHRQLVVKEALAEDLICQRRTLREAAAILIRENAMSEYALKAARAEWPGRSDQECIVRHLVFYTISLLDDALEAEETATRLEAELQTELKLGGFMFAK
jgi:hypothetical protein